MADLTPTAAQVALVNEFEPVTKTYLAAVAITAGQLCYENTSGKAALVRANATTTVQGLIGIALNTAAAGKPVVCCIQGSVYGLVGSQAYGLPLYASATTGGGFISDAAITGTGNVNVCIGRVASMTDDALTKVAIIDIPQNLVVAALP